MTISARNVEQMHEIAALLRDNGVQVIDIPGWERRGQPGTFSPVGFLTHHDASTRLAGEWGALGYITAAVLSQWQGARCLDGIPKVARVAAGVCWHAGVGGPAGPIPRNSGNRWLMAGERANDGVSEPYTDAAVFAERHLEAAVLEVVGAPRIHLGHKEWATPPGRKSDPRFDMTWWRGVVETTDLHQPPHEEEDMPTAKELATELAPLLGPVVRAQKDGKPEWLESIRPGETIAWGLPPYTGSAKAAGRIWLSFAASNTEHAAPIALTGKLRHRNPDGSAGGIEGLWDAVDADGVRRDVWELDLEPLTSGAGVLLPTTAAVIAVTNRSEWIVTPLVEIGPR